MKRTSKWWLRNKSMKFTSSLWAAAAAAAVLVNRWSTQIHTWVKYFLCFERERKKHHHSVWNNFNVSSTAIPKINLYIKCKVKKVLWMYIVQCTLYTVQCAVILYIYLIHLIQQNKTKQNITQTPSTKCQPTNCLFPPREEYKSFNQITRTNK